MSGFQFPEGTHRQRATRQSLELTVEQFKRSIGQIGQSLGPDEDWAPVLLLESKTGERVVIPLAPMMRDEQGKQFVAEAAIPLAITLAEAWLAGFVSTAWMVEGADPGRVDAEGKVLRGPMPSADPNRIEVVSLVVASDDGQTQFHLAKIRRRPGRNPALEPWQHFVEDDAFRLAGRFGEALKKAMKR